MKQRREILFSYDVTDSNPNGDPDDDNRPRMDANGYNIVTDVRLKRTVRDYWIDHYNDEDGSRGMHVLVQNRITEELLTMGTRAFRILDLDPADLDKGSAKEKTDKKIDATRRVLTEIPQKCVDVRAFGAAITAKGANASITGTVQFSIGRSLNKPNIQSQTITSVLPSEDFKSAGTFGEFHYLDYSIILFHGIASEISAKTSKFTSEDLTKVYEGLWKGTKAINTRSKVNHDPLFLISVVSKESEFQIGGLQHSLKLIDEDITSRDRVNIDLTQLNELLMKYKADIDCIELLDSDKVTFSLKNETGSLKALLGKSGILINEIKV